MHRLYLAGSERLYRRCSEKQIRQFRACNDCIPVVGDGGGTDGGKRTSESLKKKPKHTHSLCLFLILPRCLTLSLSFGLLRMRLREKNVKWLRTNAALNENFIFVAFILSFPLNFFSLNPVTTFSSGTHCAYMYAVVSFHSVCYAVIIIFYEF